MALVKKTELLLSILEGQPVIPVIKLNDLSAAVRDPAHAGDGAARILRCLASAPWHLSQDRGRSR